MTLDAGTAAYANDLRQLGAATRIFEEAHPYNAQPAEVRALLAAVDDAASRPGPAGSSGSGGSSAQTTASTLAQLRQRLASATAALEAARRRKKEAQRFGRDIAKRLGHLPPTYASVEQRMAADLERIIAALGMPEELESIGRRVLAQRVSPPPAGAEALKPDASWAVAADVLAREALEQERKNDHTWLRPGAELEGVSNLSDATKILHQQRRARLSFLAEQPFRSLSSVPCEALEASLTEFVMALQKKEYLLRTAACGAL